MTHVGAKRIHAGEKEPMRIRRVAGLTCNRLLLDESW
jgi:hypothetical protein